MYRLNDILSAFQGLVGWEQGLASDEKLQISLLESESGLYFQEAHPLLTLRAMSAIAPEIETYIEDWSSSAFYGMGDVVKYQNKLYEATVANNNKIPTDVLIWEETTALSVYVKKKTTAGIKAAVTRFIRDKVVGKETRNIIEKRTLFDGAGRIADTIANKGRLCGFEITPLRQGGISMKLEKLGLQFYGATGEVTVYIFHSSCPTALLTKKVNITNGNGTFVWDVFEDIYLTYLNALTNAGGSWYLVYNQNELPDYMEAVNFARDWSREPCSTCNKGDVLLYREMTKYATVSPFCVDIADDWDGTLWDISQNIYTNTVNYGLNLQFSIGCDITDTMIEQKSVFADVIQKQVASDCLRAIALNPEVAVNRVQANVGRDNILYELDGNGQGVKGLNGDLEKAYKALSIDMSGLDKVCLGCHTGGIRMRAI